MSDAVGAITTTTKTAHAGDAVRYKRILLKLSGEALLAKPGDGLLDVAVACDEGVLAVHEAGTGPLPEVLDRCGGDLCHVVGSLLCADDGGPGPAGGFG